LVAIMFLFNGIVSPSTKKRATILTAIQQKKCRFLLLSVIR
jgi:hypothetical protein